MSTAKNIIENLENQIGVPNAFGSEELDHAVEDLDNAIEHRHECPECNGCGTLRVESFNPMTDRYNDYDVVCEDCEGTGEVETN